MLAIGRALAQHMKLTLHTEELSCGASMEMPSKQRDFVRLAFEIPEAQLDPVDRRIVAELQACLLYTSPSPRD